jgi:SulP family sulfate permease
MNFNAWFQTRSDLRGYMQDLLARRRLSRSGTIKIFSNIKGDLSGAIAAAIVTLLMSIGYGLIAFAPLGADYASHAVLTGVYAAVFCGFFAALFGGTPIQITAPKAPLALALASVVSSLIASPAFQGSISTQQATIVGLAFFCVFIGGVFQLLLGSLRLGNLIKYVPYPVVAGFLNGIAILLILKQINPLLGIVNSHAFFEFLAHPGNIQPPTLFVGISTLVMFFLSKRLIRLIPASLTALIVGTGLYYALLYFIEASSLGATVGHISVEWPRPATFLAWFHLETKGELMAFLPGLVVSGVVLGLLGSVDSLLSSVVSDQMTDTRHNSNRELIGQGIGNMVSSFFGGISGAGAAPEALENFKAGGRTRLSGMMCSLFILLIVMGLRPLIGKIPLAVIAGILIAVGIEMFDSWTFNLVGKLARPDEHRKELVINCFVSLLVTITTVTVNLIAAVGIGFVVASVLFVSKMGKSIIKRKYRGDIVRSKAMRCIDHDRLLEGQRHKIGVFELQGSIFFGSAENLANDIETTMDDATYCVIDMKRVNEIDSTGANIILQIHKRLRKEEKYLLISYMTESHSLWGFLVHMNVVPTMGERYFFSDTDAALEWAEEHLLVHSFQISDPCSAQGLEQMNITAGFTPEELEVFKGNLTPERYKKGERIICEGDTDRDLFILTKGVVSIKTQLKESSRTKRLLTYSPGVIFGEFSFLDGNPRSADVWAEENTEILRLSQSKFAALRTENPGITTKLILNLALELSQRLRQASAEVRLLEDS